MSPCFRSLLALPTFDHDLIARVATAIGREVRVGATVTASNRTDDYWDNLRSICFSPQINLVRDPRWGRNRKLMGSRPSSQELLRDLCSKSPRNHPRYLQPLPLQNTLTPSGRTSNGAIHWVANGRHGVSPRLGRDFLTARACTGQHGRRGNNNTAESTMCCTTLCAMSMIIMTTVAATPHPLAFPHVRQQRFAPRHVAKIWNFSGYVFGDDGAIKYIQTDHHCQ